MVEDMVPRAALGDTQGELSKQPGIGVCHCRQRRQATPFHSSDFDVESLLTGVSFRNQPPPSTLSTTCLTLSRNSYPLSTEATSSSGRRKCRPISWRRASGASPTEPSHCPSLAPQVRWLQMLRHGTIRMTKPTGL